MQSFSYWIGIAEITAFAVTAALGLAPKGIDLFSAIVLGIITAVGGGTVRHLILDVPVFWAADLNYLLVAIGASLITFFARKFTDNSPTSMSVLFPPGRSLGGKNETTKDAGQYRNSVRNHESDPQIGDG